MYRFLLSLSLFSLAFFPFGLAITPVLVLEDTWLKVIAGFAFPVIFIAVYVGVCIGFAQLTKKALIPGRFARQLTDPVYGPRRIFGTMWTAIYYNKPLYWLLLSTDTTKKILFRGFGYTGPLDFTTYPDTWIRDIPLLKLGSKAYLANRSTLGTNIVLSDGNILVDSITIGDNTVIGHLSIIGIGSKFGKGTEFGLSSATGIRVHIGDNVHVSPRSDLNHGCRIGDGVKIGSSSYIGVKAQIVGEGIDLPAMSNIPAGAIINSQADLVDLIDKETAMLVALRTERLSKVRNLTNAEQDQAKA